MSTKNIRIRTVVWNKPVGYCSPIKNHNSGRRLAAQSRKNYVIGKDK